MSFLAQIPMWVYAAASVGTQVVGAISTASSQAEAANAEAANAEAASKIASNNARMAIDQAIIDEKAQRLKVARLTAEQRVAFGASGVNFSGTPLLVEEDSIMQGEMDALNIRYAGNIRASQYKYEAAVRKASANNLTSQAGNYMTNGLLSAGGSLLGGAKDYVDYSNRKKIAQGEQLT